MDYKAMEDFLIDLGYTQNLNDIDEDPIYGIRFNLPCLRDHEGYAIQLYSSKDGKLIVIIDGGVPKLTAEKHIAFEEDHDLLSRNELSKMDDETIKKKVFTWTETIIRKGKKLLKEARFNKIAEL